LHDTAGTHFYIYTVKLLLQPAADDCMCHGLTLVVYIKSSPCHRVIILGCIKQFESMTKCVCMCVGGRRQHARHLHGHHHRCVMDCLLMAWSTYTAKLRLQRNGHSVLFVLTLIGCASDSYMYLAVLWFCGGIQQLRRV
jgi:hypothetical protein